MELTDARSCASSSSTFSSFPAAGSPAKQLGRGSLRDERGDDDATAGLVAFAVGLDAGAVFEVFVHDAPFLRAHRVHLDGDAAVQRLLSGSVGPSSKHLSATLPVAGSVEDDPLAVPHPAEGRLEAEQLQRVDRLPPFANQQPVIVLAGDHRLDPVVVLANLNLTIEVKLVQDPLNKLPNPLSRLLRPFRLITHSCAPYSS